MIEANYGVNLAYLTRTDIYIVKELAASKLVLVFEDWDNTDDGGTELDDATTTTYKKIN